MKKEEVLEASKKANKKKDEYELEIDRRGTRVGGLFALILATIYYCYEIISGKGSNPALYSIITSFCAVILFRLYAKAASRSPFISAIQLAFS